MATPAITNRTLAAQRDPTTADPARSAYNRPVLEATEKTRLARIETAMKAIAMNERDLASLQQTLEAEQENLGVKRAALADAEKALARGEKIKLEAPGAAVSYSQAQINGLQMLIEEKTRDLDSLRRELDNHQQDQAALEHFRAIEHQQKHTQVLSDRLRGAVTALKAAEEDYLNAFLELLGQEFLSPEARAIAIEAARNCWTQADEDLGRWQRSLRLVDRDPLRWAGHRDELAARAAEGIFV